MIVRVIVTEFPRHWQAKIMDGTCHVRTVKAGSERGVERAIARMLKRRGFTRAV